MEVLAGILDGLTMGFIYALVALGLTLIFGIFDTINFAHGTLYMLGAFLSWYMCVEMGLMYIAVVIVVTLLLGVVGVVMERFLFRPLPRGHLPGFILSVGVAFCMPVLALSAFGLEDKGVPCIFPGEVHMLGGTVPLERLMLVPICIALVLGLILFLRRTKIGKAIRAVSQDPEVAQLQGVNIHHISSMTFAIGCALAGLAGSLVAPLFVVMAYMGEPMIVTSFTIIIVGGLGSIPGAIGAALLVGVVESLGTILVGSEIAQMLLFGILILVLLLRPKGLFSHA